MRRSVPSVTRPLRSRNQFAVFAGDVSVIAQRHHHHHQGQHKYQLPFHAASYRHVKATVTVAASKSHAANEMEGRSRSFRATSSKSPDGLAVHENAIRES